MATGEKIEELDVFHPERIANRILGMGDVVSLVEKASQDLDAEKIKKTEEIYWKRNIHDDLWGWTFQCKSKEIIKIS